MIDIDLTKIPSCYISQVVSMNVPYGFDYSKLVNNNEILFVLHCADGMKVIYISTSFTKPCYQDEE